MRYFYLLRMQLEFFNFTVVKNQKLSSNFNKGLVCSVNEKSNELDSRIMLMKQALKVLYRASLYFSVLCWGAASLYAQEGGSVARYIDVVAESEVPVRTGPLAEYKTPSAESVRARVDARVSKIESLTTEELGELLAESNDTVLLLHTEAPRLRREIRLAYEEAGIKYPPAQEIKAKIRALEAELDQVIKASPEVQDKMVLLESTEQAMVEELQFKNRVGALISARKQE